MFSRTGIPDIADILRTDHSVFGSVSTVWQCRGMSGWSSHYCNWYSSVLDFGRLEEEAHVIPESSQ
jgi:hypothetical protein